MYKIAVIGKRADILGFMALGFRVEAVENSEEAAKTLHSLAKSQKYAVIFLCEDFAEALEADIAKYKDDPIPAILPIPTSTADNGYGLKAVTDSVIRAVGADIL